MLLYNVKSCWLYVFYSQLSVVFFLFLFKVKKNYFILHLTKKAIIYITCIYIFYSVDILMGEWKEGYTDGGVEGEIY